MYYEALKPEQSCSCARPALGACARDSVERGPKGVGGWEELVSRVKVGEEEAAPTASPITPLRIASATGGWVVTALGD